ncbi:hypothetical protein PCC7418_0772 [Halothece sp. PCC 7418]|uniref:DUF4278 domain-containing protein n=1 Tax=Halothece sp. (strain PCC 7418) TaxID=65093 RepID=UPI0002A0791F|nr:DUF4278 domain-containing protein [Halothece sp. PCC 7418]AFZ42991.1 hypothetical protein PCC7418_0772 [Halothece sp. PCC 7418]
MKLTYRGVQYDNNTPVIETTEGQVAGKYRGLDWRFHGLKKQLHLQPRANLTYRGVTYQVHPQGAEVPDTSVKPDSTSISTEAKARNLMRNQVLNFKKRQKSMLTRANAEIGLK